MFDFRNLAQNSTSSKAAFGKEGSKRISVVERFDTLGRFIPKLQVVAYNKLSFEPWKLLPFKVPKTS